MPGKKRNKQHRIGSKAVNLFKNSLPDTGTFGMVLSDETANDYGIDGYLQIFIKEEHTGEICKVQIKGNETGKYLKDGKTLSFSLDLDSAFFLIDQVQSPTALIVVDNSKKAVYWHPIQTSLEAREALEKCMAQSDAENPSITIHIDIKENRLTPKNYKALYSYFQDARVKLAKRAMLRIKTDKTLSAGVQHINEIERQILELPGFDWRFRKGELLSPGTVFSLESSDGKQVDFMPSKTYKPELAPTIKLRAKFSTKSKKERQRFEAFRKAVQDGTGTVDLDDSNIDSLEIFSGSQRIDQNSPDSKVKLTIGPTKTRQILILDNGKQEARYVAEIWVEQGKFFIETVAGQILNIKMDFKPGETKGKFNIGINPEKLVSASQQLRLLDFIKDTQQLIISFIDDVGFKRKLFAADLDASSIVSDDQYNFAKALAEIEAKTGVAVPFPLPEGLKMEDVRNAYWVHRLLTQGKVTQDITLNFTLRRNPPEKVEKNKFMILTQNPPEIYLFGKPYVVPDFTQTIAGKITELKTPEGKGKPSYKIEMKNAEISIKKTVESNKPL